MSFVARLAVTYTLLFVAAMVNGGLAEESTLILAQSGVPPDGSPLHSASGNIAAPTTAKGKGDRKFEDHGVIRRDGTDANAIDASTTVRAVSEVPRADRSLAWKKLKIIGGSTRHKPSEFATKGGMIRNGIGQAIQTQQSRQGPDGGVLKLTAARGAGESISSGLDVSAASMHAPDLRSQISPPFNVTHASTNILPLNTGMNHSIINGKGIGRRGLGTGMIGGATKNVTGVISGADFHPKHP